MLNNFNLALTLYSIIRQIKKNEQTIEDLRAALKKGKEEVIITTQTFSYALECKKGDKEAIIHTILLHFIQNSGEQQLEDVIGHLEKAIGCRIYAKNNPIRNPNKEFCAHLNFSGEEGNTLLHQAVIHDKTESIKTLFKYDINPLIENKNKEIPLDLAQGETKTGLIEAMRNQASSKKESARYYSLIGIIPGVFLSVGIGVGSVIAGPSMAIMLGAIAVSALVVGIAVGIAVYFSSQDYKQAKAIEDVINPKPLSVNGGVSVSTNNGTALKP